MGLRLKTHSRLDGVKQRAGDFAADEPAKAVNTPQRNAGDRQTILIRGPSARFHFVIVL
jgi:hypothetical protein